MRTGSPFHLIGLAGWALVPLYRLLGRHPEFLVAHQLRPIDLVTLAVVLALLIPLALVLLEIAVARVSRSAANALHLVLVAGLLGLVALAATRDLPVPGAVSIAAALALAGLGAFAYARSAALRWAVGVLSVAALLFPGILLLSPQVRVLFSAWEDPHEGGARVVGKVPVVLLILDELPTSSLLDGSRNLDPVRYPNFARLASQAYWFRGATTVAQSTSHSVPAIVTGRRPDRERLPVAAEHPQNLFTLFARAGRRVVAIESVTQLCPPALCRSFGERDWHALAPDLVIAYLHLLLPADQAARLPQIEGVMRDFARSAPAARAFPIRPSPGVERPAQLARVIDVIESGESADLYFFHLMLPHVPWKYFPSGREYRSDGSLPHGVTAYRWGEDEWERVQGYQRHLLQVGYADLALGELMASLERAGLFDRSLFIVVADHGVSFRAGDWIRGISPGNVRDILEVPLLIKLPGQARGVVSDRNVETIDILPTLAGILGVDVPWPVDGQSALNLELPERSQKIAYAATRSYKLGERHVYDAQALARRDDALQFKLEHFGANSGTDRLLRIGPRPELLGRRVEELPREDPQPHWTARLDAASDLDDVDPGAAWVPAHVTGTLRLSADAPGRLDLAIALNGVVRATTRSYGREGDRAKFTALLPESVFEPGRNRVEVFAMGEGGPLRPLAVVE